MSNTNVALDTKGIVIPFTNAGIDATIANNVELSAQMAELEAQMAAIRAEAAKQSGSSDAVIALDNGFTYNIADARATLRALISKGNKATKAAAFIGIKATLDEGELVNVYQKYDDNGEPIAATSFCLLNHTDASLYFSLSGWLGSMNHNLSHGKQGLWIDNEGTVKGATK